MLAKVKLALRIVTDSFDSELTDLIGAACADLGIVGVPAQPDTADPILVRAIITYCKMHFGEPDEYDRLKASYDEQKAQLITCTGYGIE